jgi:hypothetical protein
VQFHHLGHRLIAGSQCCVWITVDEVRRHIRFIDADIEFSIV